MSTNVHVVRAGWLFGVQHSPRWGLRHHRLSLGPLARCASDGNALEGGHGDAETRRGTVMKCDCGMSCASTGRGTHGRLYSVTEFVARRGAVLRRETEPFNGL